MKSKEIVWEGALDPSLADFLGYSISFVWCMLDGFAVRLYGKRKQWDVYPPFYIEKRKSEKRPF